MVGALPAVGKGDSGVERCWASSHATIGRRRIFIGFSGYFNAVGGAVDLFDAAIHVGHVVGQHLPGLILNHSPAHNCCFHHQIGLPQVHLAYSNRWNPTINGRRAKAST